MYQPPAFRETRADVLHALIHTHPLGLLICTGEDGPLANPLPFLLDTSADGKATLRAHMPGPILLGAQSPSGRMSRSSWFFKGRRPM